MKWQHHTLLAYSAAACGNAIYGTLQGNKVPLGRFAKAYNNGRSQQGNRTKIPERPSTNRGRGGANANPLIIFLSMVTQVVDGYS